MSSDIKSALGGLERVHSIEVMRNSHHYIVLSQLNKWLASTAAPAARGMLLDYGCGGQPYKSTFQPYITRYIGADVTAAKGVTLDVELEVGKQAPLPDESVDTILSTQVLEHIYDFHSYLADCARLLKPSGLLIISVPMQWMHHEVPYDYWRFTKFGLRQSVESAGFKVLDLRPCGGVYSLLGQIFLEHLATKRRLNTAVTRLINRLALWLDGDVLDADDTLGWMCIAEKVVEVKVVDKT